MDRENPYLLVVNPTTKEDYAVTEEGFVDENMEERGFRVDRYQDGRRYEGSLPKVTPAQREKLNLPTPTPERMTVAGAEAITAAREERANARKSRTATTDEPESTEGGE